MKLGSASYSGNSKEIFKIKDGDNVFRPLPPMGSLADKGVWYVYGRVCWGYKDSSGKNKPFISPYEKNRKTQMVEVHCAAFAKAEALKKEYNKLNTKLNNMKKEGLAITKEDIDLLKEKKEDMMRFNVESKYFLNVIDLNGKIGMLKLGSTGLNAMKNLGQTLKSESAVDICGVQNGRFVNINRQGMGLQTQYTVTEYKKNVQVEIDGNLEIVQRSVPHTLDESIIGRLEAEAFELDKIYPTPSAAEVKEIVEAYERSEAEGALVVDRVFGGGSKQATAQTATNSPQETAQNKQTQSVEQKPVEQAVVQETQTLSASESVNTTTGEISEPTPNVEASVDTSSVVAPAANLNTMSDEDFLAAMGNN